MATTTPRQLTLLADNLQLSLLDRARTQSLDVGPNKQQDVQITRSLKELQDGLEELEERENDLAVLQNYSEDLERLRPRYEQLYAQLHGEAPAAAPAKPSEPAPQRPVSQSRRNKSVRFRDNPNVPAEDDAEAVANRAALFTDQQRYTDEPERPDQSHLNNQQLYQGHNQVMQEQDDHLDALGQSVRRQRMLGIEMGNELEEQNELLGDVERGVDRHTTTLDRARRRLGNVARGSKDNWSWVTIGILICVLVLLIIVLK
ncbi:hypothetical protein LTR56_008926 [Elasticomyces elasticus]|nr:hypothetical protein LTR56_008926 [Elasticomyces elasticus]KAK3663155.1 hypothetical protein LTR22_006064 [Elasticomyces elasticus]KAK4924052.1 hypothetical protein LTR49_008792 [Elasticomyces elasticus]KAK5764410.1 hypothetical protein LTS12_005386 [Elasticomyces elasticus]